MTDAGIGLALLSFPVSIAIAVLRYRLYDLDRIVSRAVSYAAVLLLLLGGLYAGGVVGLTSLLGSLSGGGGGDLAVAGSTLAVAALFRPVTRRVRDLVDRRFNRSRLDAVQTVERFSHRLRDGSSWRWCAVSSSVRRSSRCNRGVRTSGSRPGSVTLPERSMWMMEP